MAECERCDGSGIRNIGTTDDGLDEEIFYCDCGTGGVTEATEVPSPPGGPTDPGTEWSRTDQEWAAMERETERLENYGH